MYYQLYEFSHATLGPFRAAADAARLFFSNPVNPAAHTPWGRQMAASAELFERLTRRYGKPEFGIAEVETAGGRVPVHQSVVWRRPFCRLLRFCAVETGKSAPRPKILMVAPMSGHYATLLRGTVAEMVRHADVYVTDWVDARMVPVAEGNFDLDDYIDYIMAMLRHLGPDAHVMAVCQPSVPVLAAVALMEAKHDSCSPATMTLMGGPIDTRENPTAVNKLAEANGIDWFRDNVIMSVPFPHPGFLRDVYPGFLQLSGFMSMNLDRHIGAHQEFFSHLVRGDGEPAEKHRDFYDEYLAVMDLDAAFYLQTVETVFIRHALPKGEMTHRGVAVDCSKIVTAALLTVEGENDDISGLGQTRAAHRLCSGLPDGRKMHYMQPDVGHYGVFNGSRFRSEIAPRIVEFIKGHGRGKAAGRKTGRAAVRRVAA